MIEEYGKLEVLRLQEPPNLEPSRGEVFASALNQADIEERKGNYLSLIPSQYGILGKVILTVTSTGVIS